jgi:hypothetical protein
MLTGLQSRYYNRFKKLNILFTANATVIATYPPFAIEVKNFNNNLNSLDTFIPEKDAVATGITQDKLTLRQQVTDELGLICKSTRAYALKQGNAALAADMDIREYKIDRLKDADILPLAQHVQTVITPLLADPAFAPYGITASQLSDAVSDATDFNNSIGQANVTGSGNTVANKNINAVIKLLHGNMVQFDLLIDYFKTDNPDFAAGYKINAALDNSGVRHTGIEGIITDAATTQPLAGVTIGTSHSSKTTVSDITGNYSLAELQAGDCNLSFTCNGYIAQTFAHKLVRGHIDEVDVALDAAAAQHNV